MAYIYEHILYIYEAIVDVSNRLWLKCVYV